MEENTVVTEPEAAEPAAPAAAPAGEARETRERPAKKSYKRQNYKKVCLFCQEKSTIDYKETNKLRKFISEGGKILPRRMTGTCAKHQRQLTEAIKRARHIALLPFSAD